MISRVLVNDKIRRISRSPRRIDSQGEWVCKVLCHPNSCSKQYLRDMTKKGFSICISQLPYPGEVDHVVTVRGTFRNCLDDTGAFIAHILKESISSLFEIRILIRSDHVNHLSGKDGRNIASILLDLNFPLHKLSISPASPSSHSIRLNENIICLTSTDRKSLIACFKDVNRSIRNRVGCRQLLNASTDYSFSHTNSTSQAEVASSGHIETGCSSSPPSLLHNKPSRAETIDLTGVPQICLKLQCSHDTISVSNIKSIETKTQTTVSLSSESKVCSISTISIHGSPVNVKAATLELVNAICENDSSVDLPYYGVSLVLPSCLLHLFVGIKEECLPIIKSEVPRGVIITYTRNSCIDTTSSGLLAIEGTSAAVIFKSMQYLLGLYLNCLFLKDGLHTKQDDKALLPTTETLIASQVLKDTSCKLKNLETSNSKERSKKRSRIGNQTNHQVHVYRAESSSCFKILCDFGVITEKVASEISKESHTTIEISSSGYPEMQNKCTLLIRGSYKDVRFALGEIVSVLFENAQASGLSRSVVTYLLIPDHFVSALIGSSGKNIEAIRYNLTEEKRHVNIVVLTEISTPKISRGIETHETIVALTSNCRVSMMCGALDIFTSLIDINRFIWYINETLEYSLLTDTSVRTLPSKKLHSEKISDSDEISAVLVSPFENVFSQMDVRGFTEKDNAGAKHIALMRRLLSEKVLCVLSNRQ